MTSPTLDTAADLAFDDAALGRGLAPEVEALIAQAGLLRHAPEQAEVLLQQARAAAPKHPAPLIALYRFHFYGHRLSQAREVAQISLDVAREALGPSFGQVPPDDAAARFDAAVRFYLFTLKGFAYLSLRLGEVDAGRQALAELRRLDPQDHVGGAVLAAVLERQGQSDADDDSVQSGTPIVHRGWATGAAP